MEKQDWIGLLDCNNFFVSCERLFRPDLKSRPVAVLSSNDGCIVARSQEIKDNNIPMGVPYFQVKDTLQKIGAVCFSSNLTLYRDISRRVFEVMRREIGVVEEYSIDEGFFMLNNLTKAEAEAESARIRDKVGKEVGIPVSIGLGPSRTIAKYANDIAKKTTGSVALTTHGWLQLAHSIPLRAIWGVGGKSELRFKQHGLQTVADYLAVDSSRCDRLFGVVGMRLRTELSGVWQPFRSTTAPAKSMVSSRSFKAPTTDLVVIKDALSHHVNEIARDLRLQQQKAGYIRVFILPNRHGDYVLQGASAEAELPLPSNDSLVLLAIAHRLLESMYRANVPYNKAGVAVGALVSETISQPSLFLPETTAAEEREPLMQAIDALQKQFGSDSIKLGSRLKSSVWKAKAESRSPLYTTRWTEVREVGTG